MESRFELTVPVAMPVEFLHYCFLSHGNTFERSPIEIEEERLNRTFTEYRISAFGREGGWAWEIAIERQIGPLPFSFAGPAAGRGHLEEKGVGSWGMGNGSPTLHWTFIPKIIVDWSWRHMRPRAHRSNLLLASCVLVSLFLPEALAAGKKKKPLPPPPQEPAAYMPVLPLQPGLIARWPIEEALRPDPAKLLSDQVEDAYRKGVQAYQAGHLGKARTEFDRAVDLVLLSGLDLNGYPELERDFQRKLDAIYRFELAALKEGDGFTERKPIPAAIEEASDAALETKTDPRLREKLQKEVQEIISDVPLVINDQVATYINYFSTRGRGGLLNSWRRAGRYRAMIHRIFKEEGLPQDLIYMAQAESAFQPLALSRAGARGMWQFMAFTGKLYGLVKNWWIDDRQDPEKATRAAARHLKDLYKRFGDWYLAMAAYNSGPLNVQRAVERTGHADFWELYRRNQLPRETKNYVPIIVAVTIMAKNPAAYGLTEADPDLPMMTETVRLKVPTDLRLISETIDCSVELLQELNPSLLRWVTPKTGEFDLRLPAGSRDRFLEQIALIPEDKRVWWRWHRVGEGESLGLIAKNYKTTAGAIAEVNNLAADDALRAGARLVIPIVPKNTSVEAAALGGKPRVVNLRYRVRKGDTLAVVADRFGVDQEEVKRWNKMKTNSLSAGRVLMIQTAVREGQTVGGAARSRRPTKKASATKKPAQTAQSTNTRRGPTIAAARPAR